MDEGWVRVVVMMNRKARIVPPFTVPHSDLSIRGDYDA